MIHINFVCDEPNCKLVQSVGFEKEKETYGELLSSMRSVGWEVTGGPRQDLVKLKCPEHRVHDA